MKHKYIADLLKCFTLAFLMMFPGYPENILAADETDKDKNIRGKLLPPIDRDAPKIFETASFGLG